jgi:2-C-methyl-D-erythritol 4-phosphate cytidylyltransferase/2-C-methyl-D-erythritol 2,4-cyclodiphosphate synthase
VQGHTRLAHHGRRLPSRFVGLSSNAATCLIDAARYNQRLRPLLHVTAIIAAGGRGVRFGGELPKQLTFVGGRAILERSVAAFIGHPEIMEVVVAVPPDIAADPPGYLLARSKPLRIVDGGARRQDSVMNAFRAASDRTDLIVIHDAARPFASAALISRTIAAAAESGAAVAALPARDTVKRATRPAGTGPYGSVAETLARESIFLAQTPQAFRRDVLRDALAFRGAATDEATLAERAGHMVTLVEGEATNIKITTRDDLMVADAIAARDDAMAEARDDATAEAEDAATATAEATSAPRGGGKPARTGRAGVGYDLHRLVEGRPLILGGVKIPFERGLAGHSDADAVCHAVTDAILGAAGAGDIGRHFPDTDPAWRNASSIDLLGRAVEMLRQRGLAVGNVDVTVIAERPTLLPYLDEMRARVAGALGISADRVSIKGKTNEGVGALGRGEAIAVHAVALVRQW